MSGEPDNLGYIEWRTFADFKMPWVFLSIVDHFFLIFDINRLRVLVATRSGMETSLPNSWSNFPPTTCVTFRSDPTRWRAGAPKQASAKRKR